MDYEFRIKRIEADIAHLEAMRKAIEEHLDIVDDLSQKSHALVLKVLELQAKNEEQIAKNSVAIDKLTENVNKLVEGLLREHPNGRGSA